MQVHKYKCVIIIIHFSMFYLFFDIYILCVCVCCLSVCMHTYHYILYTIIPYHATPPRVPSATYDNVSFCSVTTCFVTLLHYTTVSAYIYVRVHYVALVSLVFPYESPQRQSMWLLRDSERIHMKSD